MIRWYPTGTRPRGGPISPEAGEVNPPASKVLPPAKRLYGALAPEQALPPVLFPAVEIVVGFDDPLDHHVADHILVV